MGKTFVVSLVSLVEFPEPTQRWEKRTDSTELSFDLTMACTAPSSHKNRIFKRIKIKSFKIRRKDKCNVVDVYNRVLVNHKEG